MTSASRARTLGSSPVASRRASRFVRHRVGAVAIALLAGTAALAPAQVIKLGSITPLGSPWDDALRELSGEWARLSEDAVQLKIFSGENLKCTKKVFGLSNCCSGKGVPLLTPWLCNSQDRDVDKKDDAGLCHYVGTYCSDKILGVCVTRKQSYCCYGSKLVRILNEQGKAQLGMRWGKAKEPDCEGFLIAQFQQLDLSRMDFREVYAEFVDAAKLPDEIEMSIQIQTKIEDYYTLNGGT